jgi:hypothetical protein
VQPEDAEATYQKRERAFVLFFLFFSCLLMAHFVRTAWTVFDMEQQQKLLLRHGQASTVLYAPEAYRIALPWLNQVIGRALHISNRYVIYSGIDFCLSLAATYLFYRLMVAEAVDRMQRVLMVALYLAFLQFPLAWVAPAMRPETMPTAFYLAASLTALVRSRRSPWWTVLLIALAAAQGFVRADLPFIFGISLCLLSFAGETLAAFGSRMANLLRGLAIVVLTGVAQVYLQFVRFPHLSYLPGNDVIQLWLNLRPHALVIGLLALLPIFVPLGFIGLRRMRLNAVDALSITTAVLYFPLWFTVGVVFEVRIYVPLMMALCMVIAKASAHYICADDRVGISL